MLCDGLDHVLAGGTEGLRGSRQGLAGGVERLGPGLGLGGETGALGGVTEAGETRGSLVDLRLNRAGSFLDPGARLGRVGGGAVQLRHLGGGRIGGGQGLVPDAHRGLDCGHGTRQAVGETGALGGQLVDLGLGGGDRVGLAVEQAHGQTPTKSDRRTRPTLEGFDAGSVTRPMRVFGVVAAFTAAVVTRPVELSR